ncbi:Unknown protein sequence, partial [Pseudomonas syringae pv. broussonetiae]
MPPDPIAVTADQALSGAELRTSHQRFVQILDRNHLAQPGGQINRTVHFLQQAARHPHCIGTGAEQAQITLLEVRQIKRVEVIHQHSLQIRAEHGLHGQLPACFNAQPFGQTRALGQLLIAQPFGGAGVRVKCRLLQRFQGSQTPVETLQLALRLLLRLTGLLQSFTQLLNTLDRLLFTCVQFFKGHVTGGEVFAQFQNGRIFRIGGQQLTLFGQTPLAFGQAFDALFKLLNARLLDLRLALWLGGLLIEDVPLLLPALHGRFGVFQGNGRLFGGRAGHFLLGLKHLQLFAQGGKQGGVVAEMGFGFLAGALCFAQVVLQLTQPLLTVL